MQDLAATIRAHELQGDVVVARVHLLTGVWTERIHPDGTEDPRPGQLTHAVVNAALAHAGALLGLTDLGLSHGGRAGVTRSALLWACHAAVAHRDQERDPWDLRELAEGLASHVLESAIILVWGT